MHVMFSKISLESVLECLCQAIHCYRIVFLFFQFQTFNYFEACKQAMDVLCHFSSDDNITALATKLCAILSAKVTDMQT